MLLCIKQKKKKYETNIYRQSNNTYGILSVFLEQSSIHCKCLVINQEKNSSSVSNTLKKSRLHFSTELFYRNTFF